ncbi:hypothetical protein LINPERHAP1_LOCUS11657 [Linum perenne]
MREIRKNAANRRFIKVSLDSSELNVAPNFLAPDAAYFSPMAQRPTALLCFLVHSVYWNPPSAIWPPPLIN